MSDLIGRYAELRGNRSAQARGRLLNDLIADVLRADGMDAEAGVRGAAGRDEVDVAFEYENCHYILEAKWLKSPASVEAVAVLADRLESRPSGTRGVLLSMSGFTKAVVDKAADPRWKQITFLDRDHVEAMLSGLITPGALLRLIHRHTARHGGSYMPLQDLLLRRSEIPQLAVTEYSGTRDLARAKPGITQGRAIGIGTPGCGRMTGLAITSQGHLLITTEHGILRVDPATCRCTWLLALAGCHGRVFPMPDGSVLTVCRNAAVRWQHGRLTVVGGGLYGERSHLLAGPEGEPWAFTGPRPGILVQLRDQLGDEQRHPVYVQSAALDVAWLHDTTFFISGNGSMAVVDVHEHAAGRDAWREAPVPWPYAAARLDATSVVVAQGGSTTATVPIVRLNLATRRPELIAELPGHGVHDIAVGGDGAVWVLMGSSEASGYAATAVQLTSVGSSD